MTTINPRVGFNIVKSLTASEKTTNVTLEISKC
jgi:hypothetical protein